ncbi:ribosome biogenesis GTP-binding protein YihA/YsxC [Marinigracilibium pacificum]|uniref:Probable GTP-binding protein EngB n=1 Tax=Marinigracilibium pacificum TaxID=2729599 RepID=A0A848IZ38_9BACT|nr:ribosome biogenesis GTP-binding protein YihA/YsxC [Marinigracilibium pacificum]NMM48621.1 YihA family ribosome biogenesis GTP-binding protein [Marinigracilibium pacificum]
MDNLVKSAKFIKSETKLSGLPKAELPEYAFIGRSNVGKSSLINMLTGQKKLAKISSRPGKTQLMNHFIINDSWYLVDLPGYGWAKVSKSKKDDWNIMINNYIANRENLTCLFVLIDIRHDLQPIDHEFMNDLILKGIPFARIFTKADKLSKNKVQSMVARHNKYLKKFWETMPPTFVTSSETGQGREDIIKYIEEINKSY